MIPPPKRHGSVALGRTLVIAGWAAVTAMNGYLFEAAQRRVYPLPFIAVPAAVVLLWMTAGAVALCLRRTWGRYLILVVLCLGSIGFGVGGILITLGGEETYEGMTGKLFTTVAVYTVVTVVLACSQHVRRLTSRIWD